MAFTSEFNSRDLKISWLSGPDSPVNIIKDYELEIYVNNQLIRNELVTADQYIYTLEQMRADQGPELSRSIVVKLRARDTFLRYSPWSEVEYVNSRPEAPAFSIEPLIGSIKVNIDPILQDDIAGYVVYRETASPTTPSSLTVVYNGPESTFIDTDVVPGTTYYYNVAAYDVFDTTIDNVEISGTQSGTPLTANNSLKSYSFKDIQFTTAGNVLSWTSGTAIKTVNGVVTTDAISAGSVTYVASEIFVYYDEDTGEFEDSTDLAVALGSANRQVVATYRGGTDVVQGLNEPIIDGSRILAGTIGANQLIAGEVITSSAQIRDLTVDRINIKNGAVSDSAAFSVFPAGGFVMDEVSDNILWQSRSTGDRAGTGFTSIAYGNGLFVSVSNQENFVRTSSNGSSWFNRSTSFKGNFIAFGNGVFVVTATELDKVYTSPDGIIWTARPTGTSGVNLQKIKFTNNQFVAVDPFDDWVLYSSDGITWTSYDVTPFGPSHIVFGNGTYVGWNTYDSTEVSISTDGITWTNQIIGAQELKDVAFGNNIFVTVGFYDEIFSSSDGITWTQRTSPIGSGGYSLVKFLNNRFIAVNGLNIVSSTDGITWIDEGPVGGIAPKDINFGNGRYVAIDDFSGAPVSWSSDLSTWNYLEFLPNSENNSFGCVAHNGSGTVIALTTNGLYKTASISTDGGLTWVGIEGPGGLTNINWRTLTYGNGLFVAVRGDGVNNAVFTSPDGITWTQRTTSTTISWTSVVWNGSLFVLIGNSNALFTSPDGITWTFRTGILGTYQSVAWGAGLFVAVGGGSNLCQTSPNGVTWTARTIPSVASSWQDVIFAGGQFVAVGSQGEVATSPDGITWSSRTGVSDLNRSIAYDGTQYLVIGNGGNRSQTSNDGINWTGYTDFPLANVSGRDSLIWAGSRFIAVGEAIAISADGINWQIVDTSNVYEYSSVVYGNGRFVAVASDGMNTVLTSEDGDFWTVRIPSQYNSWRSVAYGNNTYVAVASDGTNRVMTSPDGITWTNRTAAAVAAYSSVCYGTPSGNPLFVAVSTSSAGSLVMTSPDGITWTGRTASQANAWQSVTWTGTLFVAVSSNGTNRVMTSPDGITWTNRTAAAAVSWKSVAWNGSLLVAVADTGTAAQRVMTSPDGITWTSRTAAADNNWTSVTAGGGLFIAVSSNGTNRSMYSSDGINWVAKFTPGNNSWSSVTYGAGLFIGIASLGNSTTGVIKIDSFNANFIEFFDTVKYDIGLGIACPSRLIIEPGLFGSASTFLVNGPTVNGTYIARFATGFTLYKYDDTTYSGTPTIIAQRGQKSLEYEWRNQLLTRAIGADQVEALVSPIIVNKDIDYVEGNGLALALNYASYSSNPLQVSIIRSTPGFGFTWSAFWK